ALRDALGAAGDDHAVHAGANAGGGGLDRRHARRAMTVVRQTRDVRQAEVDGGVARHAPAALERLAHDDVVDVLGRDARALERLADRRLGELEHVDVRERALARRPDGGAGGGHDDGIGHDLAPLRSASDPGGAYLTPESVRFGVLPREENRWVRSTAKSRS